MSSAAWKKCCRRLIGEDIELSIVFDQSLGHVKADPANSNRSS